MKNSIKREQSQACLNFAERKNFRLQAKYKILLTLALLLTAATGAWAVETVETTLWEGTCTDDGVEINSTTVSEFNAGDVLRVYVTVPVSGANFKIVYKGESNFWEETTIPSVGSDWPWLNDGETYKDVTFTEDDITALTGMGIYIYKGDYSTITKVTLITPAPAAAEPAIEVTTNKAENDTVFTEAWFNMPAFDATADYELVRDMSVQMTATMGDGTDGLRYRVKKVQQGEGYEPADMDMMQVLALVAVNDGIEQKDLTLDQDFFCRIYKLDEQTLQPEGDGVELIDFDFAPGLYALKAFAKDDSDYAGETALSNTFKLFQGYQVEVAAKEFITYYKDEPLYVEDEAAELYTIESVNGDQAVLSDRSDAMPSNTPMLVYNKSNETKVILLIPCAEPDMAITVAPEFQGTLTGTTIAASTENQNNYAFNGLQFVWVKNAVEIGPNKAWLEVSTGDYAAGARAINIVFGDATGISNVNVNANGNDNWYDLNGRKLSAKPVKKGLYIVNGKKVLVK